MTTGALLLKKLRKARRPSEHPVAKQRTAKCVPVLSVLDARLVGGAEMGWIEIMELLDPGKFDLQFVCGTDAHVQPLADRARVAGVPCGGRIRVRGRFDFKSKRAFQQILTAMPPGIVHFNQKNLDSCRHLISVARRSKHRLMSTVQDKDHKEYNWLRERKRHHAFSALERIICLSHSIAKDVSRYAPSEKLEVIPLPLAPDKVKRSQKLLDTKLEARTRLGLRPEARIAITIGVDVTTKGQGTIVEYLPWISTRVPDFQLLLVGGDPQGRVHTLYERARALGCEKHLLWIGFKEDVLSVLAAADCMVHANQAEGLGRVLQEALLMERPVVAYGSGGVVDVVCDGEEGILVEQGDVRRLADALSDLLTNPHLCLELGRRGRKSVLDKFQADKIIDRYHGVFQSLYERAGV